METMIASDPSTQNDEPQNINVTDSKVSAGNSNIRTCPAPPEDRTTQVDRANHRDLSLFRITWDFLQRALFFDLPFFVSFQPSFGSLPHFHSYGWPMSGRLVKELKVYQNGPPDK